MAQNYDIANAWSQFDSIAKQEKNKTVSKNMLKCRGCGYEASTFDKDVDYVLTCPECGMYHGEDFMTVDAEWMCYNENPEKSRALQRAEVSKKSYNPFDNELKTIIPAGVGFVEYTNKEGKTIKYDISRSANQKVFSYEAKAFWLITKWFDQIAEDHSLSQSGVDIAKRMWGEISKSKVLTRADPRKCLYAHCLYYGLKLANSPREMDYIIRICEIQNTKKMNQAEKIFRECFVNHPEYKGIFINKSGQTMSTQSMYQDIYNMLGFDIQTILKIESVYKTIKPLVLGMTDKTIIAGVMYYVVSDVNKSTEHRKKVIAEMIGICVPTMDKSYKLIKKYYANKKISC